MTFAACLVASLLAIHLASCSPYETPADIPPPGEVQIRYHGHSMVSVADRLHTVVVDPFQPHTGFPVPELSGDLVLVSRDRLDNNNVGSVKGSPKRFGEPGVFILGALRVTGIPLPSEPNAKAPPNVAYRWSMERVVLLHLGDLAKPDLTDEQAALLGGADVMFCPVGGDVTLDASSAVAVVRRLAPRVVIPVRYKTGPSTLDIAGVGDFVDRMPSVRSVPSAVRIRAARLPARTEVWVMDWR